VGWVAIEYTRESKQILAYHISEERSTNAFSVLLDKLKQFSISQLHTDAFSAYNITPDEYNRTKPKDQTCQVESFNNLLRHYVPRLKEKHTIILKLKI
jgi:IS1 family transposase